MKGKTKTILTVIIAILVFAIAVVGTVTFLKDDGETSAAEGTSNVLPVTGSDDEQTNSNGEQNPTENLNGEENPANAENGNPAEETTGGNTQGTTTTGNQETTTGGNTQTEPEPTVIEQERLVSTTLNWSNISLNSTIGEKAINYTNLGYTIRYYQVVMDKEIVLLNTETGKAEYATTVTVTENQIKENCPIGYKLAETSELSVKITENVDKNVIEVYYIKDESQTHDITYTVKHYIDGEYQKEDDFTDTQSVWVNDTEVEVTYELDEDKYVGYKLDSNDLTETATNGKVFSVNYVKDESQTHDITYTVKHYVEGTYQEGDDFTETKTVWVNDTTIPVTYELDEDKYVGYKLDSNDLTETATDGKVFSVNYVKDESQTKQITYTVKHYIEGTYQEGDNFTETKTVWVNDTTIPVTYELDEDKYVGYKLDSDDLTKTATDGTVFNVYYVKDQFTYIVKYFYEGTDGKYHEDDTYIPTPISADYEDVITTFEPRTLNDMYVLNHVTPADKDGNAYLVISADETANVLEVYYERNLFGYKVEYYKDSVSTANKKGETEIAEQKVGTVMTAEIVSDDFGTDWLNAHKPTVGYQDGEVVEYITIQANNSNVIQVVYRPQTNIPYTVEYYFNGEPDTSKNYPGEATFGSQIETVRDYSNNGEWTIDTTKSTTLPFTIAAVSGNVIKVYYVKPTITVEKTIWQKGQRLDDNAIIEAGSVVTYKIIAKNRGYSAGKVTIKDEELPQGEIQNITATGYTETLTVQNLTKGIELNVPAKSGNTEGTAQVEITIKLTGEIGTEISNTAKFNDTLTNTVKTNVEKSVHLKTKSEIKKITNSNVILVLDVSGSMNEASKNDKCTEHTTKKQHKDAGCKEIDGVWYKPRISVAKDVIKKLIDKIQLPTEQTSDTSVVEVIRFAHSAVVVGRATKISDVDGLKKAVDDTLKPRWRHYDV